MRGIRKSEKVRVTDRQRNGGRKKKRQMYIERHINTGIDKQRQIQVKGEVKDINNENNDSRKKGVERRMKVLKRGVSAGVRERGGRGAWP